MDEDEPNRVENKSTSHPPEQAESHRQAVPASAALPKSETPGIVALDITEKFKAASFSLSRGEVVKDGFFTLYESVGALEIMDPKMDSGCVESEAELEESYDVARPLLPEEVLGIIDQLLSVEMAWHLGYPLSQTLLTSVYIESLLMPIPHTIDEAYFVRNESKRPLMTIVLRAYCLGVVAACSHVNAKILNEHFYEEEDFVTNTYNRDLLSRIDPEEIVKESIAVRDLLAKETSISRQLLEALESRLKLRELIIAALQTSESRDDIDGIRSAWQAAVDILPLIQPSHPLSKPVPEAFSAKLQRKLASTMPPRPIVQINFDDAFGHLSRLLKDAVEIVEALNYQDSQCLQTFVFTFQAKKPQPLVFVRTLLQSYLFSEMVVLGKMSIRQLLDEDLSIVGLAGTPHVDASNDKVEVSSDPRYCIAQEMESFRKIAAESFLDILRTFCQNRCRVRRTLCHTIRDWDLVQNSAEEADARIQTHTRDESVVYRALGNGDAVEALPLPLASWAFYYKIRQMEWVIQFGFELEIYQPDEISGMYWHLNHLARLRIQHIERIKAYVTANFEAAKKDPAKYAGVHDAFSSALGFIRLSMLDAAVTWECADALSCLYQVLTRLGLIEVAPRPYSTDELRYELRMKPFSAIGWPGLLPFDEFTEAVAQSESSNEELLEYAENALAGARKGLEALAKMSPEESFSQGSHDRWLGMTKNWLRSTIAAGIAASAVRKAVVKAENGSPLGITVEITTPAKAYHEWWIVPRILPVR